MTKQNALALNGAGSNSPDFFIQQAISSNASVEVLERLFALKERHDANEAKTAFIAAMQGFQKIKPVLPKSKEVKFNGKLMYKFCPLDEIESRIKPALSSNGLSYRFANLQDGDRIGMRCIVTHSQGHSEHTDIYAAPDNSGNKNSIQAIGSTSTYLQRYALISAFALVSADEDDDGRAVGDLPLLKLLEQNELLRDVNMLKVIVDIKESLEQEDYETVVGYLAAMPDETKTKIWISPSNGGIFSTKEIAQMKSNEYAAARTEYYKSIQDNEGKEQ